MRNFALFFLLLSVFWALPSLTMAQQSCPSDEITDHLIATDPVFARSYMYLEQAIAAHAALDAEARSNEVYVIPVVVHVIHEGEPVGTGSNISDAQVLSAIAALNEDFRKLPGTNGDGEGVDVRIEFCLASRSPGNQASTGIVRVNGTSVPLYAEQGIEATGGIGANEEAVKALSTWPRTQYMNIWVVNEIENNDAQGGIQGFAYFPVNSPIDGITVLHNAFGTVGNIKSSTPLNRTLTHEAGHYFGLYHTFHATNSCAESNCISGGDKVCDTPPTPLNSDCNDPECAATQLVENYMDYTAESCKNMFTEGQKTRMRATLESDRASLLSSLGCEAVAALDCGISHIVNPTGNLCSASFTPSVTLTNYGANTLTACKVHYNLDGVGNNFINWNGNLASGLSVNITLPVVSASAGLHNFFAWTSLPNNEPDQGTVNDQSSSEFFVSTGSNASLLVQLDIFGTENTWEIVDANNAVVAEGGPFVNNQQGTEINTNLCIPGGCYTLVFHDSYGDGQDFTYGDFTLFDAAGTVLVFESDNWGEEVSNPFCVEDIVPDGTAPEAAFTASTSTTCANAPVSFTDASSQSPTSWSWTFEGGTPATSNDQHPQNISYAAAGTYDVTLTVSNPFGTNTYTWPNYVVVNADPVVTLSGTNPSCFGSADGQVQNTVTGAGPFSYAWNNGQTSQHLSGVGAGVYIVTVTDANGCQKQKTKTLTQPSAVTVNANIVSPSCHGMSDGSLYAQAIGGTQGYSYAWSNGSSAQQVSNASAGSYTVTVTDLNGCTVSQSYSVSQPQPLAMNLMSFDIACTDEAGSAQVNPSGGTGPYTAEWSSGASGLQSTGLAAGNYQVEVSDANGCSLLQVFAITASENLSVLVSVDEISCYGMADGAANVFVGGGTGIYTYDWSNGSSAASLSNLDAGTYNLQVIDSEGCEGSHSFTLEEPDALSLAVFKSDISCYGLTDGSASATCNGGTGPYIFNWSNGTTGVSATGLDEGLHLVMAQDTHGCSVYETFMVMEPSQLVGSAQLISPETCTGNNGSVVVNIMGGTPGYIATWSTGTGAYTLEGLSAGLYTANIMDGNGCMATVNISVPYDCSVVVPETHLTDEFCNSTGHMLSDVIYCEAVPFADMYQWMLIADTGEPLAEQYSVGNAFYLFAVNGISYGMTLTVQVRARKSGVWGTYGLPCSISMSNQSALTSLDMMDCGALSVSVGDTLSAIPIASADAYEFHITGDAYDFTVTQVEYYIVLTDFLWLSPGATYNIRVRTLSNESWSEWGESCKFTMAGPTGIFEFGANENPITFYPNPGSGTEIFIDLSNLSPSDRVKDLEIYGTTGNLIETISLSQLSPGMRAEYKFRHPLSTGMYVLRYTLNGYIQEEKLVVR